MISIFFSRIPRCLFEPLAVCAVLGIILALWLCRKKQDRMFWLVSCSLFFMIFWRVGVEIVSGRYASILIYPTVILVSYFCFHLKELPGMTKVPEKFQYFLPWCLLLIATGICIGKNLRFNRYENYLRQVIGVIREDARNYRTPLILTYREEHFRTRYYSLLDVIPMVENNIFLSSNEMRKMIRRYSGYGDALYFLIDEKQSVPPLTAESVGVAPERWKLLISYFQDNRKRKRFSAYRYLPPPVSYQELNGEEVEKFATAYEKFRIPNGNFELLLPPESPETSIIKSRLRLRKLFREAGASFFERKEWDLPDMWSMYWTGAFKPAHDAKAELELSSVALVGKYSLRLKGNLPIIIYNDCLFPKKEYELRFLIRGRKKSQFGIFFHIYDDQERYIKYNDRFYFRLLSDQVCAYRVRLSATDFETGTRFRICMALHTGEIFLDEISLTPINIL